MEFARRPGDFAVAGVAVLLDSGDDGVVRRASIALGGVGEGPIRCPDAEAALVGTTPDDRRFDEAARICGEIEAMEDVHASAAYRRHLARVLTRRALARASGRARRDAQ